MFLLIFSSPESKVNHLWLFVPTKFGVKKKFWPRKPKNLGPESKEKGNRLWRSRATAQADFVCLDVPGRVWSG